jgi:hypothetical protein
MASLWSQITQLATVAVEGDSVSEWDESHGGVSVDDSFLCIESAPFQQNRIQQ